MATFRERLASVLSGARQSWSRSPSAASSRQVRERSLSKSTHWLRRYLSLLPDLPRRRVVVLAHPGLDDDLAGLLTEIRSDELFILAPDSSPDWELERFGATLIVADGVRRLNQRLKAIGPVDVIVDLLATPAAGEDAWRPLFYHLRARGVYVLRNPGPAAGGADAGDTADRSGLKAPGRVELFLRRYWGGADPKHLSAADKELLASCAWFHVDRRYLLIGKRQNHHLKLRDHEVGRLLPQRNTTDTVTTLATVPEGHLTCRGTVISHETATELSPGLPLELPYPRLHLQHYRGRLGMARNQLLYADATVLPGSYRYPLDRNLANPRLTWVNRDFGRLKDADAPRRTLTGDFYHLDCWHTGHFGHVMVEVVSRLWGWHLAKAQLPGLKAVFCRRYPNERHPGVELALFTAFGIDRDDIVWTDEPVWLSSVVTATPMWQNDAPYFVHPQLGQTWDRLRSGMVSNVRDPTRRIFVGRSAGNRSCRNADRVEEVFRRSGFVVVRPEELSFAEQATVFGHAEVVAGFGGSGLYNILYAGRLRTLIVLNHEAYTARYEHLYTMLLGCTTHYFWSTPDVAHPVGGWTFEAYRSAWSFDFERNGAALASVLAELD